MLNKLAKIFVVSIFMFVALQGTACAKNGHFTLVNNTNAGFNMIEIVRSDSSVTVHNSFFVLSPGGQTDVDFGGSWGTDYFDVIIGCNDGTLLHINHVELMKISRMTVNADGQTSLE